MTARCHLAAPQIPVWRGPSLQELTLTSVSGATLNTLLAAGQCSPDGQLLVKTDGRLVCVGRLAR